MAVVGEFVGSENTRLTVELDVTTTHIKEWWTTQAKGQNIFVKRKAGDTQPANVLLPPVVVPVVNEDNKAMGRLENAFEQGGKMYGAVETIGLAGHVAGSASGALAAADFDSWLVGGANGKLRVKTTNERNSGHADYIPRGIAICRGGDKAGLWASWDTRFSNPTDG